MASVLLGVTNSVSEEGLQDLEGLLPQLSCLHTLHAEATTTLS